jgi:hypothetical protein
MRLMAEGERLRATTYVVACRRIRFFTRYGDAGVRNQEINNESQNTGGTMTSNENKRAVVRDALRLLRLETSPMEDGVARITIVGLSEAADAILAAGLVQDESAIRYDEREKCAKVADDHVKNFGKTAGDEPLATTMLKKEVATEIANAIRSGHEKREL